MQVWPGPDRPSAWHKVDAIRHAVLEMLMYKLPALEPKRGGWIWCVFLLNCMGWCWVWQGSPAEAASAHACEECAQIVAPEHGLDRLDRDHCSLQSKQPDPSQVLVRIAALRVGAHGGYV
eukprot:1156872-Pelagomonas_calceolata.AAC.7